MPFSAGTFSLFSVGNPVVTGTTVSSAWANNTLGDISSGLSTCVLKDGTQTLTANIPMGGFKLTGLAAGTTNGDSVRYEQLVGAYLPLTGGTLTGNLLFTDATYDIGASGATRPRDLFLSRNAVVGGTLGVTGVATFTAQPIMSSLTASRGVLTDGSKGLISADAPIVNTLSVNVTLNNTGTYFDGPSCAQGTTGTWFASGTVTVDDSAAAVTMNAKLWDGTTVIASCQMRTVGPGTKGIISLSGFITSPAGNIRISVNDSSATTGTMYANASGASKDSTLSVIRIA